MTLIDFIAALILLGIFLFGFSQAFFPAHDAWNLARAEYSTAHTIQFVIESFRKECAKTHPNMESWKKTVSVARELESCEIIDLKREEEFWILKTICIIAGERLEIIGVHMP